MTTKTIVDETFSQVNELTKSRELHNCSTADSNNPYFFYDVEGLENFIEHFKDCLVLSGSLFITYHLKLRTGNADVYEREMDLLDRFGHLVGKLEFTISYANPSETLQSRLIRALNYVPSLKRQLKLKCLSFV
ncbi:unnamed protein product [Orchesella dallaii]|uniref:Uncharacterized protein n=1 Tax=Orchesella dallaii TaxID=48710 RepID=A0ABP1PN57_9HEXA